MPAGTVKVNLIGAAAIKDSEWIGKADPYVVIWCGKREVKSNVAKNQGSTPVWNQKFHFYVDDSDTEVQIKIYNENALQTDDIIGTTTISLADAFSQKKLPITRYSLEPKGDISLQISYTPKVKPAVRLTQSFPGPYSAKTHSSPYVQAQPEAEQDVEYFTGPYGQHQGSSASASARY
ncbi:hypothetical protein Mapa_004106 [Marchantia paleacea]|nr:hypothetical protein Mapa_004106 [Marchantia paleacea]